MTERLKNESGFALILTLVITALMVAVVVEMIHQVYVDTSISRGFRDGQQASILAESGVTAVQKALSLGTDPALLSGYLAQPLSDEVGSLEINISDESGKININGLVQQKLTEEPKTLASLKLLGLGLKLPDNYWDSVKDWIVKNDSPRYRNLTVPYNDSNRKLKTLTELSLIKGKADEIKPEMVDKLRPYLTIYPANATSLININTASKDVLATLEGIDGSMAARIVAERRVKPFGSLGELSRVQLDSQIISQLSGRADVKSNFFRITSVAKVKESVRIVEAVVSNGVFLSWQEYY